jgi:hypothetical protein
MGRRAAPTLSHRAAVEQTFAQVQLTCGDFRCVRFELLGRFSDINSEFITGGLRDMIDPSWGYGGSAQPLGFPTIEQWQLRAF